MPSPVVSFPQHELLIFRLVLVNLVVILGIIAIARTAFTGAHLLPDGFAEILVVSMLHVFESVKHMAIEKGSQIIITRVATRSAADFSCH